MPSRRFQLGLAALILVATSSPRLHAATYQKAPYLIPGGAPGTMGIVFQATAAPTSVVITWGTTPEADLVTAPAPTLTNAAGFVYRTILTGLPEGQRIYYKVTMDGLVNTGSFVAPRSKDLNDLSFYVYGDTRTNVASHNTVAQKLMADLNLAPHERATFLMHCGDYVATGSSESDWTSTFFSASSGADIRTMLANIPLVGAIGNHEGTAGLPVLKKYFPYTFWPSSGLYYSFDQGPVHVTVVDSETLSYTAGSAQYTWLKADLEGSSAPMKIVMWHSPAYSAGGGHTDVTALQTSLVPLCEQNGVQVVICGDNHYYARVLKNGVQHITSGGGGAPLYTPVTSTPGLQKGSSAYHFVRFDVKPSLGTITGTVVNSSGSTIETFSLATNSATNPITITTQPQDTTVTAPAAATFSVVATGPGTLAYQWKRNGVDLSGATSSTYTTPATSSTDSGAKFSVVVSDGTSTRISNEATLTVTIPSGNLALGKAASASGTYSTYVPANAFDGVTSGTSYWAVSTSNPAQWLAVDLGAPASVSRASVQWSSTYYARAYALQYLNGSTWTTVWSTTAGTGGTKDITFPAVTAQKWRINATTKKSSYYKVYEFQLFN